MRKVQGRLEMKAAIAVLLMWTSTVHSFITVPLDYRDPIIKEKFCPSQMETESKYSKFLTREAIRLEVRKMMMDEPPREHFFIPEDTSLPAMFRMYYGETASPMRFVKAINNIAWANAEVDTSLMTKHDPRYHFDAEKIHEGQELLASRHNYIVSSIRKDQAYPYARELLGMSLHGIQNFYSHTSWIELKNADILEDLGIPGLSIPNVARAIDVPCRSCGDSKDGCSNNVIAYSKLTSGYYEFNMQEDFGLNITKPLSAGKCSYGGSYDDSRAKEPTGGINKASSSKCFSPHFSLHEKAAYLAIKASQSYLATIRDTIGNNHFRKLLDIYHGSAMAVVMDTTGSMSGEIKGVKEEVKKIVASVNPEVYILVPFSDPGFGPTHQVEDGKEFIRLLEQLKADGGGDAEEMSMSGLQLALSITPEYSSLYLFTDAGSKDQHLFNSVLLLAQSKHIKVTVVYTAKSPADYYRKFAELTGGQLIEIGKESFDSSVPIIHSGVEESKVQIAKLSFNDDLEHKINFPVDDTVTELKITTDGTLSLADLKSPTGKLYHLADSSIISEPFETEVFSDSLKNFLIKNPESGMWEASVHGKPTYKVMVEAASILGCLVEITEFDPLPPRPGYKRIDGRPLAGLEYHIELMLVGWSDSNVKEVTAMNLLSTDGKELSQIAYDGKMRDEIFIKTDPLIRDPFYLSFTGTMKTGQIFTRIFPTMITPVNVEVELPSTATNITGVAGSNVNITVLVTNRAGSDSFVNNATNSKGYHLDASLLDEVTIEPNQTREMVISFKIPETEEPWSVSEVVITAAGKGNEDNVNSKVSYLMVLPKDKDVTPPSCISTDVPDCGHFNKESNCHLSNWSVSAVLQDKESGLGYVYEQPGRDSIWLSVTSFNTASKDTVSATLQSSCCNRQVAIIGSDEQGNIGKCQYNMGPINGVFSFEVNGTGSHWINLRWEVINLRDDLKNYNIEVTSGFTRNFHSVECDELVCFYNVTKLLPCTLHRFKITPIYSNATSDFGGAPSRANSYTQSAEPDAPINVKVNHTGHELLVSWESPELKACVEEYEVCFRKEGSDAPECFRLASPNFSLTEGEAQSLALSSLSAIGVSGKKSYLRCDAGKCADDRKGAAPCPCDGTKPQPWIGHALLLQALFALIFRWNL